MAVVKALRKVDCWVVKSEENMAATMAASTVVTKAVRKVRIWAAAKALKSVNSKVHKLVAKKAFLTAFGSAAMMARTKVY